MKQRYTLTVANSQINIVTEMSQEEIDAIVGIVDRRIREIHLHSKSCSRTDAAMLLCLDYCAEKVELQKTLRALNAQIERVELANEAANKHIAVLEREIDTLRASLDIANANAPKAILSKKHLSEQIAFDQINDEMPKIESESETNLVPDTVEEARNNNAVDKILSEHSEIKQEMLTPPTEEKPHAKARKKKVRAMFDMISFDDI